MYTYIYSLLFGWRLMRFDGIIVERLDIDYVYKYNLLFRHIRMRFDDSCIFRRRLWIHL
jgi:hypothetical protein